MFPDILDICAPFCCQGSGQMKGREKREKRIFWLPATETGTGMKGQGRLLSARDRVLQEVLALKESQSVSPWEAGMAVEQATLQRY